jgi:hypothetical protein
LTSDPATAPIAGAPIVVAQLTVPNDGAKVAVMIFLMGFQSFTVAIVEAMSDWSATCGLHSFWALEL